MFRAFSSALVTGIVLLVLFETLSRPFAAAFGVCGLLSAFFAWSFAGWPRALFYNLAVFLAALAAIEGLCIYDAHRVECEPELSDPHEVLGYAALPDRRARCRATRRGFVLYDATYTIDPRGLRIAPPSAASGGAPSSSCALFFGGSFTFGQGVRDQDAMPYRVGVERGGRDRIYNFGFKGYGPHQMLAALESGWVEERIDCSPTHILYQALEGHVRRAAGRVSWGADTPRYLIDTAGTLRRAGRFADERSASRRFWERRLRRSALSTRLRNRRVADTPADLARFHGIVADARRVVEERFPGAEFHLLIWDVGATRLFLDGFPAQNSHRVGEILPHLDSERERYQVHALDSHPNAAAHRRIAAYVAHRILPSPRGSELAPPGTGRRVDRDE